MTHFARTGIWSENGNYVLWGEGGHGFSLISMNDWELFENFLLSWVGYKVEKTLTFNYARPGMKEISDIYLYFKICCCFQNKISSPFGRPEVLVFQKYFENR